MGLVLRVESSFWLDPTLNTSLKPHLQKALPCGHACHSTWDLGLGTVPSGKWGLPCSQRLRLHGCTSSDLGLETWDLGLRTWDLELGIGTWNRDLGFRTRDLGLGIGTWDLGLGTWDLGLGTACEPVLSLFEAGSYRSTRWLSGNLAGTKLLPLLCGTILYLNTISSCMPPHSSSS